MQERFQFLPGEKPGPIINITLESQSPTLDPLKIKKALGAAIESFREFLELVKAPQLNIKTITGAVKLINHDPTKNESFADFLPNTKEKYIWECRLPLWQGRLYDLYRVIAGHGCFMGLLGPENFYNKNTKGINRLISEGIAELLQHPHITPYHEKFLDKTPHLKTLQDIIETKWTNHDENYNSAYCMMLYMKEKAPGTLQSIMASVFTNNFEKVEEELKNFAKEHADSFQQWLGALKIAVQAKLNTHKTSSPSRNAFFATESDTDYSSTTKANPSSRTKQANLKKPQQDDANKLSLDLQNVLNDIQKHIPIRNAHTVDAKAIEEFVGYMQRYNEIYQEGKHSASYKAIKKHEKKEGIKLKNFPVLLGHVIQSDNSISFEELNQAAKNIYHTLKSKSTMRSVKENNDLIETLHKEYKKPEREEKQASSTFSFKR